MPARRYFGELKYCECGCGGSWSVIDYHSFKRRFLRGHNPFIFKKGSGKIGREVRYCQCGNSFEAKVNSKSKYCSRSCSWKFKQGIKGELNWKWKPRETKCCAGCGKSFVIKINRKKFCSRHCAGIVNAVKMGQANTGKFLPREIHKCARKGCSKTLKVIVGGYEVRKKPLQKYCSEKCASIDPDRVNPRNRGKLSTPREIRKCGCGECTETFKCKINSTKKYIKGHRSKEFKELMSSIQAGKPEPLRKGKNSSNWKGGVTPLHNLIRGSLENRAWIRECFQRDNFTCQECDHKGGNIEVHHIEKFSEILKEFLDHYSQFSPVKDKEKLFQLSLSYKPFWDTTNGKTLCKDCHKEITLRERSKCLLAH